MPSSDRARKGPVGLPLALPHGRRRQGVDLEDLAVFAAKLGNLMLDYRDEQDRHFDLIELNPVVASPKGTIALDALAHLS